MGPSRVHEAAQQCRTKRFVTLSDVFFCNPKIFTPLV
jgi:hypothetical protein